MDLTFTSKSQEFELDGSVKGTKVILSNDEGAIYPVLLDADKIELSNSELEKLALDVVYQKNFPQRAENEKYDALNKEIAKRDEMLEKMKKAIEKSDSMLQLTTATLNDLVSKMYPDEGDGTTDESTEEN